jgi:hypothetical protein
MKLSLDLGDARLSTDQRAAGGNQSRSQPTEVGGALAAATPKGGVGPLGVGNTHVSTWWRCNYVAV